jgi:hypothetical protein
MRWRNDDEKKLVLEAAAEYGKRLKECEKGIADFTIACRISHFEEWLRWYFAEGLHTQSVSAYMSGSNHKPSAYEQPVPKSPTPTTTKQEGTLAWGGLLESIGDKKLSKPQYVACIRAYEKNVGELPKGTPLARALESLEGDYVRGEILKAVNSA